jgi:hypothetical protein
MKALLALSLVSGAAFAGDAELLRCLDVSDNATRLGCYDTLAQAAKAAQATPQAKAAAVEQATQNFGRVTPLEPPPLEQLLSHIPGTLDGWTRGGRLRLANGQVWQVNDDSANVGPLNNPKVSISPGLLGSFFMTIEGVDFKIKVKRLQ